VQTTSALWKSLWASGVATLESVAVINGVEYTDITPPVINRALMQEGLSVGNAVRGARYQVYRTTSLAKPFEPWGAVVEAKADGLLDFAVETDDSPSAFFKVEPVK
jgi:hypothetical protein